MSDSMQLLSFNNLAQRILFRYAFTFADFVPIKSETVSINAQRRFHELCGSIIQGIADNPSILGISKEYPDECLSAHDVLNRHPELYKVRNECQKAFNDLSCFLFTVGIYGEHRDGQLVVCHGDVNKLTTKTLAVFMKMLEQYGLFTKKSDDSLSFEFPECPEALLVWKLLATKCSEYSDDRCKQAIRFALWIHNDDGMYFLERIKTLLGLDDRFFDYIDEKYRAKEYNTQFVIDEYRIKFLYTKDVGGLSIEYATLWPTVRFVNNTSIGIKAALEHVDGLSEEIRRQLVKFCKPCNDCMGCTKGGKNKQFTVTVHLDGNEYRLCPEFVQMEWYNSDISREKIDFMLELNELQEQFGKNWRKKK